MQAIEADGPLRQPELLFGARWVGFPATQWYVWEWTCEIANVWVASNHLEASWECFDVGKEVVVIAAAQVNDSNQYILTHVTYASIPPT